MLERNFVTDTILWSLVNFIFIICVMCFNLQFSINKFFKKNEQTHLEMENHVMILHSMDGPLDKASDKVVDPRLERQIGLT